MNDHRQTHFESLYRASPDPWNYTASPYEQQKYAATLAALLQPHYASAIEVGCSIGVLSAQLAARCDRFLGLDLSPTALQLARQRLASCRNVALRQVEVPRQWPRRKADLIVLSEVLYYLSEAELAMLARHVDASLMPGGEVVIVASRGPTDTPLTGLAAARAFTRALCGLRRLQGLAHAPAKGYLHRTLRCQACDARRERHEQPGQSPLRAAS
jgi:trans-aconitate methyltransferase